MTQGLDKPTLDLILSEMKRHGLVEETEFLPDPDTPERLRIRLDSAQYPLDTEAYLDVRWHINGSFRFHYHESGSQGIDCRWDRHENPHNNRLHFHPPDSENAVDLNMTVGHPLEILDTVMARITERVEELWDDQ